MQDFNCPNCGSLCPIILKTAKLVTCQSCGTTLFLKGDHIELAGEQGVMHEAPQLFVVGDTVELGGKTLQILGHARYSYGRGFWDEYCGISQKGLSSWISVDEGDVVEQSRIPTDQMPKAQPPFKPGETLTFEDTTYTVTEVEQAECIALRGQFDEELQVGETYRFVNAAADGYRLLSGEFWGDGVSWYEGRWRDPFGVKVLKQT
jgi:DNA-directed RNA polymerase subunit RPC12/RpoP